MKFTATVATIVSCLGLLLVSDASDTRLDRPNAAPISCYVGPLHSGVHDVALFLCFTSDFKQGWFREASSYVPIRSISLSADALSFAVTQANGESYSFRGSKGKDHLRGEIITAQGQIPAPGSVGWDGVAVDAKANICNFSNRHVVHEGAEENVGVEVTLFDCALAPKGFVIFYESYWGEETYVSLALLNIKWKSHSLAFQLDTGSKTIDYELTLTQQSAILMRQGQHGPDGSITLRHSRLRLPRRSSGSRS